MADIKNLVKDIYDRISTPEPFKQEDVSEFCKNLTIRLSERLSEERKEVKIWLSNLGSKCDRKLWYAVNKPALSEPLPGHARLKFLIGDIWEETLLFLARASGHSVEGEQERVSISGVTGRRDAIIDGRTVDVKSASSRSFQKFKDHELDNDDPFGYITQGETYALASQDDPRVTEKDKFSFLAGDKTLGHLVLDTYKVRRSKEDYEKLVAQRREMLAGPFPERGFEDEKDGESGNRKLGVACSYCEFKKSCWPDARIFLYSGGPRFLTRVVKPPYNKNGPIQEVK